MEAAEETLTYRDDTGLDRKLLPQDKDKENTDTTVHGTHAKSDESIYVDLDVKPEGTKTVTVSFTGDGNQVSVIKCDGSRQGEHGKQSEITSDGFVKDTRVSAEPPLGTATRLPDADHGSEDPKLLDASDGELARSESDELQYTDMYLNSKSESDDGVSAVLSDHCGSDTVEDESHYITTHEIQLTELDHDVDYDLGRGSCWDFEDDNLVYSFVDYASFESDDTQDGALLLTTKAQPGDGGAPVGAEHEESDLCDSDKCASSDESVCKSQRGDAGEGKFQLSIRTCSRAVNDPVKVTDNTGHFADGGHVAFVRSGARAGPLCDRAQYFIPAPGRQHLATKLRRKDINEYSSGASSSISELDDADKEVRNLTAKSFRSLACPYFDAINFSTSSESSVSEYGLNKWSAYVDWNYGNMSRGREQSVIAHTTSSATLEMKTVSSQGRDKSVMNAPNNKMYDVSRRTTSQQASTSCRKIAPKDPVQPKQRGVTLNLRCNVEGPEGTRRAKCSKMQHHHTDRVGDTHKKAMFASSLLKNVISKKMQFEQERKMERGEICDTHPPLSSCSQLKDQDGMKDRGPGRGLQKHTESGCGLGGFVADDQRPEGSRTSSCEPAEEQKNHKATDISETEQLETSKSPPSPSRGGPFNLLKEDEAEAVKKDELSADRQTTAKAGVDTSSLVFVPSCQLLPKKADLTGDSVSSTPETGQRKCETELKSGSDENAVGKDKGGKTPEIKICLRNVNENKGCTLNIANLLTPRISNNAGNMFRPADDAKLHILSATDKVPNFTVRDIRETKCKFQTPIYQVRDVRKLVKSSYRFVSLDNSEGKCSTVGDKPEEKAKKEPVKHLLPSPIVIKCQSVKTNVKSETTDASESLGETCIPDDISHGDNASSNCTNSRAAPTVSKQPQPDNLDIQQSTETKLMKQRQDKFTSDSAERRNEPTLPKQAAIEKLKAAVKTMEQLYDFDRNEWKRKTHAPQPITDSHLLSLIASEKQVTEEPERTDADRNPQSLIGSTETGKLQDGKGALNIIHVPYSKETLKTQPQQSRIFSNKSVLHFGNSNKTHVSISSVGNPVSQSSVVQSSPIMKSSKTLVAPLSVKIEAPKHSQVEQGKAKMSPTPPAVTPGCSDYLTIPRLGYTNEIKLLNREPVSTEGVSGISQAHSTGGNKTPEHKSSPLILDYPATSIYHHPVAGPQTQQQVLCFSSSVSNVSPASSTGETVQPTQRKMLLDPTTGHYYLVDTPIQATTKRLFDPETGQYVDVPMPQSPVAPVTPVTPVPLSLSPLALSPGAFAPTYMIYPSFIPSPTLPAQAVLPQSQCRSEDGGGEKFKNVRKPRLEANTTGAESAYYSPIGDAPQGPLQVPVGLGHVTTRRGAVSTEGKPVISITTQQGPRIIAPPSFDGTTMSFVVEHR